jgi:hypothetical protein
VLRQIEWETVGLARFACCHCPATAWSFAKAAGDRCKEQLAFAKVSQVSQLAYTVQQTVEGTVSAASRLLATSAARAALLACLPGLSGSCKHRHQRRVVSSHAAVKTHITAVAENESKASVRPKHSSNIYTQLTTSGMQQVHSTQITQHKSCRVRCTAQQCCAEEPPQAVHWTQ